MDDRTVQEKNVTKQLRIVFKAVQSHSRHVEKLCGLSSAQLWMLYEISLAHGIKVTELAAVLSIHRSTCSNMLDKLENKDLICRDRSKSDQRTVHLHITEKGTALLASAPYPPQGKLSSTLAKLSPRQLGNLEESLHDFIDALHFDDDGAGLIPIQDNSET